MSAERIHVMAAALRDGDGRILIQRRRHGAHLGGLWEFPGGKLEPGESRRDALARELREELGITLVEAAPLIAVPHDYPDKRVLLDVWTVDAWSGQAHGREGQPVEWVAPGDLRRFEFPAADRPVLAALALPAMVLITPEPGPDREAWLDALCRAGCSGIALIQVRAPRLSEPERISLAAEALVRLRARGGAAQVMLNAGPAAAVAAGAHGVHLNSRRLWQLDRRPPVTLVGASCHHADDLRQAARIGADFALLGPVLATRTHPDAVPMGWDGFSTLVSQASVPVYGLGGLGPGDVARAREYGGQGIAAIRGLWPEPVSVPGA